MNVVAHRARFQQRAFLIFNDSADVGVEFVSDVISQQFLPILRREDQMHEDLGQRLRHTVSPLQGS